MPQHLNIVIFGFSRRRPPSSRLVKVWNFNDDRGQEGVNATRRNFIKNQSNYSLTDFCDAASMQQVFYFLGLLNSENFNDRRFEEGQMHHSAEFNQNR